MSEKVSSKINECKLSESGDLKLHFAHLMPSLWVKLKELKRAGWSEQKYNVSGEIETVQEHTTAMMQLVESWDLSKYFDKQEQEELVKMLEVHDWAEAATGDEILLNDGSGNYEELKVEKLAKERRAMKHINRVIDNGHNIESGILELWERFTTGADEVAKFARQMDKYQAVEKALEYEMGRDYTQQTDVTMFEDFYNYALLKSIRHPFLLKKMSGLMKQFNDYKVIQ